MCLGTVSRLCRGGHRAFAGVLCGYPAKRKDSTLGGPGRSRSRLTRLGARRSSWRACRWPLRWGSTWTTSRD